MSRMTMVLALETVEANATLVALSIFAGALGIAVLTWFAITTRPNRPRVPQPTMDLGPEPPAVVDLLTDDFQVTPEAVTATLLDLAARRWLSIEELIDGQIRVRLRRRDGEGPLLAFERRVLEHLRRTAVDGVIPAAALTTGPEAASDAWWKGFRREVVAEARSRGLSRARWPTAALVVAWATTIAAGGLLWLALPDTNDGTIAPTWPLGVAFLLSGTALYAAGRLTTTEDERDTPTGLDAATHWVGVRRFLAEHGNFADASPASVVVWDRYLAHAAALDLATRAVRELPLGAEDDRHAWSSVGGDWRPVTVCYPRARTGWGKHPVAALLVGLIGLAFGAALTLVPYEVLNGDRLPDLTEQYEELDAPARTWVGRGLMVAAALGVLVLVRSGLQFLRGAGDLVRTREIEGLVLRRRRRGGTAQVFEQQSTATKFWRLLQSANSHNRGRLSARGALQNGSQPKYRWYVAVDDGTSYRIDAWSVRQSIYSSCNQHQRVKVSYTPALGYVRSVEVLAPAPPVAAAVASGATTMPPPPPGTPAAALLDAARSLAGSHTPTQ